MKNIDIFGEPMKIKLNNQFFIQTGIGGILTLLTILLVLIFTWFIGRDIIYKEKPISYVQTDMFEKFLNINITKNNFPFSFTMTDDDNVPLVDFSYLTIKFYSVEYVLDEISDSFTLKNKTEIPTRFCKYEDFPLLTEKQFENTQLGLTLCPNIENYSFNLYGYWNEEKISYLQISIEGCKNNTNSNLICKTNHEIKQYIADTGSNLNIYYIGTKVLINNNTHPIEFLTSASYKYVIPEYYKKSTFKIQTENILTDNGFVFNSNENLEFFKMIEEFTDIRLIDEEAYQLLVFEIFSSNISDTYNRRYVKVADIIASLGGIFKVFNVVFLYLNTIFSQVEKNISIVNEVFVLNKKFVENEVERLNNAKEKPKFNRNDTIRSDAKNKKPLKNFVNKNKIHESISDINYNNNNNFNKTRIENNESSIFNHKKNTLMKNNFMHNHTKALDVTVEKSKRKGSLGAFENFDIQDHEIFEKNLLKDQDKEVIKHNLASGTELFFAKISKETRTQKKDSSQDSLKYSNVKQMAEQEKIKLNTEEKEQKIPFLYAKSPKSNEKEAELSKKELILKKYLEIRKSHNKLNFGFCDVMYIALNNHCNKKIPKRLIQNFNFYKKAQLSVEHYFDFIFMIKKFEEINILKDCLLNKYQAKMVELMCKPILSEKEASFVTMRTVRSEGLLDVIHKDINDFLTHCNHGDNIIDFNILKIINDNVVKSYVN